MMAGRDPDKLAWIEPHQWERLGWPPDEATTILGVPVRDCDAIAFQECIAADLAAVTALDYTKYMERLD